MTEEEKKKLAEEETEQKNFVNFCRQLHAQYSADKGLVALADLVAESNSIADDNPTLKAIDHALEARKNLKISLICMNPQTGVVDPNIMQRVNDFLLKLELLKSELLGKETAALKKDSGSSV